MFIAIVSYVIFVNFGFHRCVYTVQSSHLAARLMPWLHVNQNYFSLRRRLSELMLYQCVETCLKLFSKLFHRLIAAREYFATCSLSLK